MIDNKHNNNYHLGDVKFDNIPSIIKIDDGVSEYYEDQMSEDLTSIRNYKSLQEDIYSIFKDSEYFEKYNKQKKIDKNELIKMFYFFKSPLSKMNRYSNMEIFIGFAEFFEVNYDYLYSEVSVLDKEFLLKELNDKYGLSDKIKNKRLF